MFSASERWNSTGSCCTMAIWLRSDACRTAAMSCPSMVMRPPSTSYRRWISLMNVVLPEPEWPTRPTRSPGAMRTEKSRYSGCSCGP
ncbi:Uncharacterised protein [Bordetella pertussis]|nr:Uncharacterised protein [Bordetella pertussis]